MTSHYFSRMLTSKQVKACIKMLESCAGDTFPFDAGCETFSIAAPDGEMVFAGIRMGAQDIYLCRFHLEVFNPDAIPTPHQ